MHPAIVVQAAATTGFEALLHFCLEDILELHRGGVGLDGQADFVVIPVFGNATSGLFGFGGSGDVEMELAAPGHPAAFTLSEENPLL